ncbi:Unknown protein [Striga hermonthica]|uniref:Late embryogenesis abundant protein LEA-2 subgroup domain-containing protein n=1 Tax=Striga hermonthica TaxID=68872 RepID=A0A9N7P5A5_STRHE|nr:Unknown protein [Striga hermonthica]
MGTLSPSQSTDPKEKPENHFPFHHEPYYNYSHSAPGSYPPVGPPQLYPPDYYNYYYNHHHHQPPPPLVGPTPRPGTFGRFMLILMALLLVCMCMTSLAVWFLYGVNAPEFEVSSLRVSNFTAGPVGLTAFWDASLLVANDNRDVSFGFRHVRSVVLYQGYILGFSSERAFGVEGGARGELRVRVEAGGGGGGMVDVDNVMVPELAREWEAGGAVFELRLAMTVNVTSGRGVEYRQHSLTVACDGLRVETEGPPGSGEGKLTEGGGAHCLISM